MAPPSLKRQACSARHRVSGCSDLARALANCPQEQLWSPPTIDHPPRLPEPPAWLGCGDQPILGRQRMFSAWPPSGRHRHALQHRAAADRLRARHRPASCPLQVGLLPATADHPPTTSSLRASADRHIQVRVPHQHVGADSSSCLPASLGSHTLQSEATPAQHSRPRTSCSNDGHISQVDGHIGSCAKTREEHAGDDARGSRGRGGGEGGGGESWSPDGSEPL